MKEPQDIQYFEVPRPPGIGLCSDKECPCSETQIPQGEGFLYISESLCTFRHDCLTYAELLEKLERIAKSDNYAQLPDAHGVARFLPPGTSSPILMCKKAAELRGVDLNVSSADAKHWWETGLVPLRPTPYKQLETTCNQMHKWWQFWAKDYQCDVCGSPFRKDGVQGDFVLYENYPLPPQNQKIVGEKRAIVCNACMGSLGQGLVAFAARREMKHLADRDKARDFILFTVALPKFYKSWPQCFDYKKPSEAGERYDESLFLRMASEYTLKFGIKIETKADWVAGKR